jgi:hypothetical protein
LASTVTIQSVVNLCRTHVELMPIADVGGYSNEPALTLANQTLQELLAMPFDWKFNSVTAAILVTQGFRQDYLFAGATAFTSLGGVGIDLVIEHRHHGIRQHGHRENVAAAQLHGWARLST